MVEWLLANGADVNAKSPDGYRPSDFVEEDGSKDIVEALLFAEMRSAAAKGPQAVEQLMRQWEQESPPYIIEAVGKLRHSSDPVDKYIWASYLGNQGYKARGGILALIETFS